MYDETIPRSLHGRRTLKATTPWKFLLSGPLLEQVEGE